MPYKLVRSREKRRIIPKSMTEMNELRNDVLSAGFQSQILGTKFPPIARRAVKFLKFTRVSPVFLYNFKRNQICENLAQNGDTNA